MKTGRRVVITGMGAVTPLGGDAETSWRRLIAGDDAVSPIELFDVTGCRCQSAAAAKLPSLDGFGFSAKKISRLSRATRLALPAAAEALGGAGLLGPDGRCKDQDLPLSVSTSAGGMGLGEEFLRGCMNGKRGAGQLFRIARYQPQQQVIDLQEALGFRGPLTIIANACASGGNAIGHGADLVRGGRAERVLAGGYEALTELLFVGFDCIQAMTTDKCRPFDRKRSGLILGEAAAFFVLESEASAKKRGAKILCEVAGYGQSTDLHHLTAPEPAGKALVEAMSAAEKDAGIERHRIGYINAHGTATVLNDGAESSAYAAFFDRSLEQTRISSTKAAIGHTLGAAGAVEAFFTAQALITGEIPPQLNLNDPEPKVAGSLAGLGEKLPAPGAAMSVNLGFGGANAALILKRHDI